MRSSPPTADAREDADLPAHNAFLYLVSEIGRPQRGARTVPVRSASVGRGAQAKSDDFGPDKPLRTGTVRGPMERDVPSRLNRYHVF